ncbi:DUF695 domain-containing protein [Deminuibacter soli]|uniref:DUF695 domain-containing protein n=1 Tax=Deminuibacter soli TaxID=2291815 RepID=A0A3E1NJI2_9BACT|nr:DUF695 domain-containing protein [Deminuibacter soli]RFM28090.1 DUF695 domain-containing protein [Deminuibacter soli]
MDFIKQVFGLKKPQPAVEPIFPGEHFTSYELQLPQGLSLATVNHAYDHYANKAVYSWHVLVELEILDRQEGHVLTETEQLQLNDLRTAAATFLGETQTVHYVGNVLREGFMDLLYYIDTPLMSQPAVDAFCNGVMKERGINFTIENDPEWNCVGLIK